MWIIEIETLFQFAFLSYREHFKVVIGFFRVCCNCFLPTFLAGLIHETALVFLPLLAEFSKLRELSSQCPD